MFLLRLFFTLVQTILEISFEFQWDDRNGVLNIIISIFIENIFLVCLYDLKPAVRDDEDFLLFPQLAYVII